MNSTNGEMIPAALASLFEGMDLDLDMMYLMTDVYMERNDLVHIPAGKMQYVVAPHLEWEEETNPVMEKLNTVGIQRDNKMTSPKIQGDFTLDHVLEVAEMPNLFMDGEKVLRVDLPVIELEPLTFQIALDVPDVTEPWVHKNSNRFDGFRVVDPRVPTSTMAFMTMNDYKVFEFDKYSIERVADLREMNTREDKDYHKYIRTNFVHLTNEIIHAARHKERVLECCINYKMYSIKTYPVIVEVKNRRILVIGDDLGYTEEIDGWYFMNNKGTLFNIMSYSAMEYEFRICTIEELIERQYYVTAFDLYEVFFEKIKERSFKKEICENLFQVREYGNEMLRKMRPVLIGTTFNNEITIDNILDIMSRKGKFSYYKMHNYYCIRSIRQSKGKLKFFGYAKDVKILDVYSRVCDRVLYITNVPMDSSCVCTRLQIPYYLQEDFSTENGFSLCYISIRKPYLACTPTLKMIKDDIEDNFDWAINSLEKVIMKYRWECKSMKQELRCRLKARDESLTYVAPL